MSQLPFTQEMIPEDIGAILDFVRVARSFDPIGYCSSVLVARVQSRLAACGLSSANYLAFLKDTPTELNILTEALTIKFSSFFRDPLTFEYLNELVLPTILSEKATAADPSLRVWSAGCAHGEEPYSVAILLHELARLEALAEKAILFATDIDENALVQARAAVYPAASLSNVRLSLLNSSFTQENDTFRLIPAIANRVRFSVHDMLDTRSAAPAESVFGTFDLILCRNLLIYFQNEYQEFICEKLYRSLAGGGFLLLGRTESLPPIWAGRFQRVTSCCSLYRKPIQSHKSSTRILT